MRDPYTVLGVSPNASDEDIKKAYHSLARKCHPDLHPGDQAAAARMNEINRAYDQICEYRRTGRWPWENPRRSARQTYGYQTAYAASGDGTGTRNTAGGRRVLCLRGERRPRPPEAAAQTSSHFCGPICGFSYRTVRLRIPHACRFPAGASGIPAANGKQQHSNRCGRELPDGSGEFRPFGITPFREESVSAERRRTADRSR